MGAYTTADNIEPYIADILDGSSVPTETAVNDLIAELEAEVNGWLKHWGLTTPLTDPENIEYLRGKINYGVACTVWGWYVQDTEERPFVVRYCQTWNNFSSNLIEGVFRLPNQENETPVDGGDGFSPGYKMVKIRRV